MHRKIRRQKYLLVLAAAVVALTIYIYLKNLSEIEEENFYLLERGEEPNNNIVVNTENPFGNMDPVEKLAIAIQIQRRAILLKHLIEILSQRNST